jgi:hypothetical protein
MNKNIFQGITKKIEGYRAVYLNHRQDFTFQRQGNPRGF